MQIERRVRSYSDTVVRKLNTEVLDKILPCRPSSPAIKNIFFAEVIKSAAGEDRKQAASQASSARMPKPKDRADKLNSSATPIIPKMADTSSESESKLKTKQNAEHSSEE